MRSFQMQKEKKETYLFTKEKEKIAPTKKESNASNKE